MRQVIMHPKRVELSLCIFLFMIWPFNSSFLSQQWRAVAAYYSLFQSLAFGASYHFSVPGQLPHPSHHIPPFPRSGASPLNHFGCCGRSPQSAHILFSKTRPTSEAACAYFHIQTWPPQFNAHKRFDEYYDIAASPATLASRSTEMGMRV